MPRRLERAAAPWMLTLLLLVLSLDASAKASILSDAQRIKQLQRQVLLREPMERKEALERLTKALKKGGRRTLGMRARRPGESLGDFLTQRGKNDLLGQVHRAALSAIQIPQNALMNDTTAEDAGTVQSEISMASHGSNVIATWNDGIGVTGGSVNDVLGFAYSTDGGLSWTDGGVPSNTGIGTWASDPVVAVNEKTGEFYFAGLADQPAAGTNSVAVVKGSFGPSGFTWGTPSQVQTVPNSLALLDKEWIAVDSLSGNVYCSYSYFGGNTDEIRFERSQNGGQSWSSPITLSSGADAGYVQGSRPSVGPSGEVYVVWHAIGPSSTPIGVGPDYLRVRRSGNFGVSFAAETTPASLYSNFGSGGPGFNRGLGITFPGISVDRSTGPYRGRVYLSWSEAVNFPNDTYSPTNNPALAYSEVENNNGAAIANHFTPGSTVRGTVGLTTDLDYFQWDAVQGTTYMFWVDSLSINLDASLRVFCTDAANTSGVPDNLAFSQNGSGGQEFITFTAPSTASYYLRIASYAQGSTGKYRIRTAVHNSLLPGRSRDQRDVFVASSDNGVTWNTPVRANDSPGYYDDFLPEVAVDGRGHVFMACYDYRDAAAICGGGTNTYLYESTDGGASFGSGVRMSDFTTQWATTYSTLIPNQGDYIGLFARDSVVFAAWADCRAKGDPDAYVSHLGSICAGAPITSIGSQSFGEDSLVVIWSVPSGMVVDLLRRDGSGPFVNLGQLTGDANNYIVYSDTTVVLDHTYTYRLGTTGFCLPYAGDITVTIAPPKGPDLTLLNVWPNPTRPDDLNVSFLLDGTLRPATIALVDITGREVKRVTMIGQGPYVISLLQGVTVKPGMYFVRLAQGGVTRSRRVSIFP